MGISLISASKTRLVFVKKFNLDSQDSYAVNKIPFFFFKTETEGCYCQVNHILKDIIVSTAQQFDYVVIDGEAGIEQINRRVMENVSHLVLVSDQSQKGLQVVKTIKEVSRAVINYESCGLILNKLRTQKEAEKIRIPGLLSLFDPVWKSMVY